MAATSGHRDTLLPPTANHNMHTTRSTRHITKDHAPVDFRHIQRRHQSMPAAGVHHPRHVGTPRTTGTQWVRAVRAPVVEAMDLAATADTAAVVAIVAIPRLRGMGLSRQQQQCVVATAREWRVDLLTMGQGVDRTHHTAIICHRTSKQGLRPMAARHSHRAEVVAEVIWDLEVVVGEEVAAMEVGATAADE